MRSLPTLLRPVGAAVLGCLLTAPVAFAADGEGTPLNLSSDSSSKAASSSGPGGGSIVRTKVGQAKDIGGI